MSTPAGKRDWAGQSPHIQGGRSWLLALDTATDQAGLAMFNGELMAEMSWPGGRQQTTSLLPALDGLLNHLDVGIDDVGAVAVATGPGSFTGLRVGLSLAKGLAIPGDVALIGVNTLDILAAPYVEAGMPCVALVPAGRGRVVWGCFTDDADAAPVNTSFEDFLVSLRSYPAAMVVGELTPDQRGAIAAIPNRVTSLLSHRRPGVLARLGYDRWRAGDSDNPVTLEPVYLHGRPNPR